MTDRKPPAFLARFASKRKQIEALRDRVHRLEAELKERTSRQRGRIGEMRRRVDTLRNRIDDLENELQEAQRLNRRVAELADLVQETLIPAADRDDDRVRERLEEYRKGL